MTNEQLIEKARSLYADEGYVEIDDNAQVSKSPDGTGTYVQAWVWVEYDKDDEEEEESNKLHQYIVTYKENGCTFVFEYAAEDAEHAYEQCKNAYPKATVVNVTRFDMEDEE